MTKSTGEIRAGYAEDRAIRESNNIHPTAEAFSAYFSDFDEWLAAHDREVAAKAIRSVATGWVDWDILRGYSKETPEFRADMETARLIEQMADHIENGTMTL